jgi:hypothetical protein
VNVTDVKLDPPVIPEIAKADVDMQRLLVTVDFHSAQEFS